MLKNEAILLEAERDLQHKKAGEQWLVIGPTTYQPEVGVEIIRDVKCYMIAKDCGLMIRALLPGKCSKGVDRYPGEEWMVRQKGLYIPTERETVTNVVKPIVLTEKRALQLKAKKTFQDIFNKTRKAGEEWLVTN